MVWQQVYDPFGNMFISTALGAVPVVVMLAALGFFHIKAHIAAVRPAGVTVTVRALHGGKPWRGELAGPLFEAGARALERAGGPARADHEHAP